MDGLATDANYEERTTKIKWNDMMDMKYGYEKYTGTQELVAWLVNTAPSELCDEQTKTIYSSVDFYFFQENGCRFKISLPVKPYLYLSTTDNAYNAQVGTWLEKKYPFLSIDFLEKEDLDLKNHLSGLKGSYIKLTFPSTVELMKVKKDLMPIIRKNREKLKHDSEFTTRLARQLGASSTSSLNDEVETRIIDIREHDVAVDCRIAIDEKIFVGKWYTVCGCGPNRLPSIVLHEKGVDDPLDPTILAFDIECTKLPLKFPDATIDEVMMISYMIDGNGFLIINRSVVSEDIDDFEYDPREDVKGFFKIFNEKDEESLLRRFFSHILKVQPHVIATYNGDFFDWPFVEARAAVHGISMQEEIGFSKNSNDEYYNRNCIHMDAFRWVKRDSYLPVGSQNLKAVAKAKLRYDPMEVDPEEMCTMARQSPQTLANYSVSDAVATYFLYMKYVHPFVFALCTIIPLPPDDVLRKGSGTLCEVLLMVEAFHNNIIFPNKSGSEEGKKWSEDGHLIETETYVGGHVEALQAGVFRCDLPARFRLAPAALTLLRDEAEATLADELKREMGIAKEDVENWEEAIDGVRTQLNELLAHPARYEKPRIYHLDVGAMYPNIILTNRLQPSALVDDSTCMACVHNRPNAECKRKMDWEWRGELLPMSRSEYQRIIQQLEGETFDNKPFHALPKEERLKYEKKRIQDFCRRAYGKLHVTRTDMKVVTVCQKENSFYVDTVRAFRDRRYDYKELLKKAKRVLDSTPADDVNGLKTAKGRVVLFESLQLAHKCILNSFYGYVMRRGSRWFSMEMAGVVCHTGANIITEARKLVDQIGMSLELDTDGIWCLIPSSFPENVTFNVPNHPKKKVTISYPAAMLNAPVHQLFTNHQYHYLQPDGSYKIEEENSIYFEVDGPYKAIILPASKEEGKKLKKRYAVFNMDDTLAELKGFELKRRGELNIIKQFQSTVFKAYLRGNTLQEAYASVAKEADYWLDVLFSRGVDMSDRELFEMIGENRNMSRKLEDYGGQKSTSISTAKRLAEFLGDDITKDAGLACRFLICKYPADTPVTERALPIAIFQADPPVAAHFLRKWTKMETLSKDHMNIRDLIDWSYYIERMGSCIQKIVTIPAALQGLSNPVPRIENPDWLKTKLRNRVNDGLQSKMTEFFSKGEIRRDKPPPRKEAATEINKENEPCELGNHVIKWIRSLQEVWRKAPVVHKTTKRASIASWSSSSSTSVLSVEEGPSDSHWMWTANNNRMERIILRSKKIILVNQKTKRDVGTVVRRVLPRGHELYNLYEHMMDQSRLDEHLEELRNELCSADIEGIYETEVPAMLRVMSKVGCVARMDIANSTVHLDSVVAASSPYLAHNKLTPFFYYKVCSDTRCVVACLSGGEGIFLPVNCGSDWASFGPLYANLLSQRDSSCISSDLPESLTVTTKVCKTVDEADREIERWLRRRMSGVCLLNAISSDSEIRRLRSLAIAPVIPIHVHESPSLFNSLDLQRLIPRRILQHYLNSPSYLQDAIEWAGHLHLPVGNVPADPVLFGLDLLFTRHLVRNGHALWASNHPPDLGGREVPDVRLSSEWRSIGCPPAVTCSPSFIPSYTIDVQVGGMAVSALINRNRLMDAEGTEETMHLQGGEEGTVSASVNVLRQLFHELVREIALGDTRSDELVNGLRRWVQSPSSLLYDPAIARFILLMEKKLCVLLSTEIERLGARVLFASPSRFVLSTEKKTRDECEGFSTLLVSSLSSSPLFGALHFQPTSMWETLMFKDCENFARVEDKQVEMKWRSERSLDDEEKQEMRCVLSGYLLLCRNDPDPLHRATILRGEVMERLLRLIERNPEKGKNVAHACCDALSADDEISEDVESVRRQLEKASGRRFDSNVPAVYVSDVLCDACGLPSDAVDISDQSAVCSFCSAKLSEGQVDVSLCAMLSEALTAFLVQDHVCVKCKRIRRDNLSMLCECSNAMDNTIPAKELSSLLSAVGDAASRRRLPRSSELRQWLCLYMQ